MATASPVDGSGRTEHDLQVRPAVAADVAGIAHVHVRGWQHGYAGLLPQIYLDGLRAEDRLARWTDFVAAAEPPRRVTLVAVQGDQVVGFADLAPTRDTDSDEQYGVGLIGELRSFYVDPARWRQGIGRQLMTACQEQFESAGYLVTTLWVLSDNDRAIAFYRRSGWIPDGSHRQDRVAGAEVTESRFRYDRRH